MKQSDPIETVRAALAQPGQGSSDFDLNPKVVLPEGRKLRPAAVLVGLVRNGADLDVILTKRSSSLRHHPGQIAFPGGKVDSDDKGAEDAARREAREEIGLPSDLVRIIGQLPAHETVTGFTVTPVVAQITAPFDPVVEAGEVAEMFQVPFGFLTDLRNFRIEGRRWRGSRRYYYTVPFGPYYVWGATARILRSLAEQLSR